MMRLSRYLSICGVAARRKADEMIQAGRVRVNGKTIMAMGFRVDPETAKVVVDKKPVEWPERFRTVILNKPAGVVTTAADPEGRKTVMDFVDHYEERLFSVGRLDRDSEGLLIFTNDGELAFRLAHPRYHLEKEYEVAVEGGPEREDLNILRKGVELEGKRTAPAEIRSLGSKAGQRHYAVVLREGRKRQIRNMFEAVGARVAGLKRVRVGPVRLGHLPRGSVREIKGPELKALREAVGLDGSED